MENKVSPTIRRVIMSVLLSFKLTEVQRNLLYALLDAVYMEGKLNGMKEIKELQDGIFTPPNHEPQVEEFLANNTDEENDIDEIPF